MAQNPTPTDTTITVISRRNFLLGSLLAGSTLSAYHFSKRSSTTLVNGHIDITGQHWLSTFGPTGDEYARVALPEQAHGVAINPNKNHIVAFPSLPGTIAPVLNHKGIEVSRLFAHQGRHFNGHGTFSTDGQLLYASQNIADSGEGVIAVYSINTFKQIKEISAFAIGPHDIHLSPDGSSLVVAGGGLKTHPLSGRLELNIASMRSNLLRISTATGTLISRHELPIDKLSIRHLDVSDKGSILISCQYKGETQLAPLVGLIRPNEELRMLEIDGDNLWKMKQYTASVRFINDQLAVVSCPRGNLLSFWNLDTHTFSHAIDIDDIDDVGGIEVMPARRPFGIRGLKPLSFTVGYKIDF